MAKKNSDKQGIFDPKATLTGNDLRRYGKAAARIQTKPEIGGYKRLIKELGLQSHLDDQGLKHLGKSTSRQVGRTYRGLAQTERQNTRHQTAIGHMLNTQTQAVSDRGAQAVQASQVGQLGSLQQGLQMRGAPGSGEAQQQLSDLVASQNAQRAQAGQASEALAASQGAGYAQYQNALGSVDQLRGAQAKSGILSTIAGRRAESRLGYSQDRREAAGKIADIKATKGSLALQAMIDQRERERDYILGKQAVRTDRRGQNLDSQQAAASLAETTRAHHASEATAAQNAQTSAKNARTSRKNANTTRQNANNSGSADKQAKRQEIHQATSKANRLITQLAASNKKADKKGLQAVLNGNAAASATLIDLILSGEGISHSHAAKLGLKRALKRYQHHSGGGGSNHGGTPHGQAS